MVIDDTSANKVVEFDDNDVFESQESSQDFSTVNDVFTDGNRYVISIKPPKSIEDG